MDATHWPKEIVGLIKPVSFSSSLTYCSTSMEEMMMVTQLPYSCTSSAASGYTRTPQLMERRTRPNGKEQGATLPCPRCKSTNTKFCYYNNYSLTQPRYFCKACRRYWTEGGSLRNVPVGGGSRKNKKSTTTSTTPSSPPPSSSTSTTFMKNLPDMTNTQVRNPGLQEGKDLGLSTFYGNNNSINPFLLPLQDSAGPSSDGFGLQCLLSNSVDFPMVTTKFQEDDGRRVFFPSENLIQVTQVADQNRGRQGSDHNSSGFWNGMIGGIHTSW